MSGPADAQDEAFARELLRAAAGDVPPTGARDRALAALAGPGAGGGATAATTAAKAGLPKSGWAVGAKWLAAIALGTGIFAAGWRQLDRPLPPSVTMPEPTALAPAPSPAPAPAPIAADSRPTPRPQPAPSVAAPAALTCADLRPLDGAPSQCSKRGRALRLELTNRCATEMLEVYWVDYRCQEVLKGTIGPGQVFRQYTTETHPWRVRDAATHRLLRDIVPAANEDFTVKIDDSDHATDDEAAVCSTPGMLESIRFVNARSRGAVDMIWIDQRCKEVVYRRLQPGEAFNQETFDTHPWRVRDAETHALLKEWLPAPLDDLKLSVP